MKTIMRKLLGSMVCFALLFHFIPVFAFASTEIKEEHQVIFILDASNSMNKNDPDRLAGDSVKQMVYSLPSNYSVGFVAYNDDVIAAVPPAQSQEWNQMEQSVDAVKYTGYTNAGAGLSTALELFSGEGTKAMVLLSDGEVAMAKADETALALTQFENAVSLAAEKEIPIYTIAVGADYDPEYTILEGSQETEGKIYRARTVDDVQGAVRAILFENFGVKKNSVGVAQAAEGSNTLKVSIPASTAEKARILITANSGISNVSANYTAANGNIISGKRFAVIELERPTKQDVIVNFDVTGSGGVRGELISEYTGVLEAETVYTDVTDEEANKINRKATVSLRLINPQTEDSLLKDAYFEGKPAELIIDGEPEQVKIADGKLTFERTVTEDSSMVLSLAVPEIDINLFDPGTATASLEAPPILPEKTDYRPLWITISALFVILILLLIWYHSRRVKLQKRIQEPEVPKSIYDFSGKLNIYVTHTPNDADIAPQTYRLYRQFSKKEISLAFILKECGIKQDFRGAATVLFQPGANRSLIITNKSDCTLLKGHELIMKDRSYPLYFEDKLTITFEDELSELTILYKNVKPSEK